MRMAEKHFSYLRKVKILEENGYCAATLNSQIYPILFLCTVDSFACIILIWRAW